MEIVGRGFLAGHVRASCPARSDVVVFAAGVSNASCAAEGAFLAERTLLDDVVRGCRATGRSLVYFSTAAADMYGALGRPGREDDPVSPRSPYGRHKCASEELLARAGLPCLVLRLAHVVGPGQRPHQLVPSLVRQVRAGQVTIHRGAHRDLIDVEHVVGSLCGLLAAGRRTGTVNVASASPVAVEAIVDHVAQRLGVAPARRYVDRPSHCLISNEKLLRLVPDLATVGFGPGYHRAVLDRYLAASARAPRTAGTPLPG